MVGVTRIELVTSSVSGKRATAAPYAHIELSAREVATGFEPVCTALQAVASPLGHATVSNTVDGCASEPALPFERMTRFELATLTLAR